MLSVLCRKIPFVRLLLLLAGLLSCEAARAAELVMFERDGCAWCRRWDDDVGKIYGKTEQARLLPLRRVNVDLVGQSNFVLEQPVRYTPTFIVVDRGREVGRITGYMDDGVFWGLLDKLAAKVEDWPNRGN